MSYAISVQESILRILKTKRGERVMRPDFGSDLYLLRDRTYNDEWKLDATRYTYEAITKYEPRVEVESVEFEVRAMTGRVALKIYLTNGESVEVENGYKIA